MTRIVVAACVAVFIACGGRGRGRGHAQEAAQLDTTFASRVERLSEPGGYFDTDNLISNEASYLHVLEEMRELDVAGGAYIGVGPDQNFSYIAQIRPHIAFIIDIRRDNMLLHLMFKALFELAANRIEYLNLLFARPPPPPPPSDLGNWDAADIARLLAYVDSTPTSEKILEAVRGERVSAFYTSNVEFYLFRSGSFGRFMENVEALPRDDRSVVIRSVFNRAFGGRLPELVPGYYSTQLLQLLDSLVDGYEDGMYRTYWRLVTRNARKGKGDAPSSVGSAVILSGMICRGEACFAPTIPPYRHTAYFAVVLGR